MSEIAKKILEEGIIPIMSDEGMWKALQMIQTNLGRKTDISRELVLSDSKPAQLTSSSSDAMLIAKKNISNKIVEAIRKKIMEMEGSTIYVKSQNYFELLKSKINTKDNPNLQLGTTANITFEQFMEIVNSSNSEESYVNISKYGLASYYLDFEQEHTGKYDTSLYNLGKRVGPKYDYRIYLNSPDGDARIKFLELYAVKCIERGLPYDMKGIYNTSSTSSTELDKTVLYCDDKNLEDIISILEEIKVEQPELIALFGSPITSAINYSYYGICSRGTQTTNDYDNPWLTYNDAVNRVFQMSYYNLLAKRVKEIGLDRFLTEEEQKKLNNLINLDYDCSQQEFESQILKNLKTDNKYLIELVKKHPEQFDLLSNKEDIISKFRDNIKVVGSMLNFGDKEHTDMPLALLEEFYIDFGVEISSEEKFTPTDITTKPTKKLYPKERVKEIFNADERQIRVEAMQAGYTFADTEGKTEQELRTMIFDKITLDNESMINILCGGDYQLKKVLVGYGTNPKELMGKSRDDLERMYIEKVGLDEIITAREEVIKQDEISGEKRTHWYENTLQAMRMVRGKTIMESEEFKSLKTKEEKRAFLDKLSVTELEDAERYYTTARNFSKIAEEIVPTMM